MQSSENSDFDPGMSPADQSPSLIDYLHIIARHRRVILAVTLAAAVISIIVSLLLPKIYTAKTMIVPNQDDKSMMSSMMAQMGGLVAVAGGAGGISIGGPTNTELYASILKSEAVKDPIIDRFKLLDVYKIKYRSDAYKVLNRNVVVTTGKKDGIITITVDDKDPKRAAAIANAYVEELGNLAVTMNVTGAEQNRNFLEERLSKAKVELAKAEDALKGFRTKNKAIEVTAQAEATIAGIADLKARLAAQEVQLAIYRRQFTESSQEVKNLVTSVGNLRAQIAKLEGRGGDSAIPSVGAVPSLEQQYIRLMREFKIQESLVDILTKQVEMASLSEAKDISPLHVILKARVPERKSKPSRANIVMIATLFAFSFCYLFFFFLENYKQKLFSRSSSGNE